MKLKLKPETFKPATKITFTISYIQGSKYIECHVCGRRSFASDHIEKKICPYCGEKHK